MSYDRTKGEKLMTKLKKGLVLLLILTIVCSLFALVACVDPNAQQPETPDGEQEEPIEEQEPSDEEIAVSSILIENKTITMESGGEYTINYAVTPANGKVEFTLPNGNLLDYTVVSVGVVKINAKTSGTGKFKISATNNTNISDECDVTVNPPQGYSQVENNATRLKFVYPSTWKNVTAPNTGVVLCYQDPINTSSNINLTSQIKTTEYLNATAQDFKTTLSNTFTNMGYSIEFSKCELQKYENNTALHVIMEYTLTYGANSVEFHQEQFIRNTSVRTYALTLTFSMDNVNTDYSNILLKEFITW